jgi:hypothetical protein
MTLIKASVVAMGIAIVLGVAYLAFRLTSQPAGLSVPSSAFDPDKALLVRLGLPAETQIRSLSVADRTVALQLAIPGQGDWIYVIPLTGEGRMLKIAISSPGGSKP